MVVGSSPTVGAREKIRFESTIYGGVRTALSLILRNQPAPGSAPDPKDQRLEQPSPPGGVPPYL